MNKDCTLHSTVDFVGKRWTLLILLEIYKGKEKSKRYSQLRSSLPGITPKMLSARLKELEKRKLVKKKVDASTFPVKCNYSLTDKAEDFIRIIKEMKKWELKWNIKNKSCSEKDCSQCVL